MTLRPSLLAALALLAASIACAPFFSGAKQDGPHVRTAKPAIDQNTTRRRTGSDVVLPANDRSAWLLGALIPCDSIGRTSASDGRAVDCRNIDLSGRVLGTPLDTSVQKRP